MPSFLFFLLACSQSSPKQQVICSNLNKDAMGLDNGTLHIELYLTRGGAISYISKSNELRNIVNIHDEGRYVQQSYDAGKNLNRIDEGQNPSWSPWFRNPIQVGDSYRNRAKILECDINENTLYVKCIPMLWGMNNKPAESIMEQWTTLEGKIIKVSNKLIAIVLILFMMKAFLEVKNSQLFILFLHLKIYIVIMAQLRLREIL